MMFLFCFQKRFFFFLFFFFLKTIFYDSHAQGRIVLG